MGDVIIHDAVAGRFEPASSFACAHRMEGQLLEIWRRALGRDDVSVDQGFYDVGGDSLSAVTVALGMERAGFPPELAHGIFDGKTIAELCRQIAPAAANDDNSMRTRLLEIWRQALGREDVSVDQGFYDVGGDSLSAVNVALGMERAGFPPELAHGIFDGKTIAQLCREAPPPGGISSSIPIRGKSDVALIGEASNLLKGIVLLCMTASHWIPLYLAEIGQTHGPLSRLLAPIFGLGSPTLAFTFGLGVAIFHLRQQRNNPAGFRRNVRSASLLLAAGLLICSLTDIFQAIVATPFRPTSILRAFSEGPLLYYLLAVASLPLWVKRLRPGWSSIGTLSLVAMANYAVYLALLRLPPSDPSNDLIAIVANLLVGHWSLFQMTAIMLMGVGTGLAIEAHLGKGGKLSDFLPVALLMAAGGVLISLAAGAFYTWFVWPKPIALHAVFTYAGLAVLVVSTFGKFSSFVSDKAVIRGPIEFVCCLGILLFPLYIAQSLVSYAARVATGVTGQPFAMNLTGVILICMLAAAYPIWRVYRLYYAGRK